ncbi:uncharacterized protein GGS25DRAFT_526291 [Hypoxylon fragiforme]|uniref:uncharacterized protein n=1 Tax=Hypoxylon fragiforme TaxID=63214 RepID=UPI0020C73EE6|nr:uncharacterized protein GGS25DRAFT_526291 [Hypoxylon fragiforme]KAI2603250.1 hypothetical protein GGS25DRAFT_526291 [Hypoxylon fragiforme]
MSAQIFHKQLLRNLNRAAIQKIVLGREFQEASDPWILDLPDNSGILPPPPELLSPWPMSAGFFFKSLWKEVKPVSIFQSATYATWAAIKTTPTTLRLQASSMPSPLSPSRLQSRRPKASRAERTPFDLRLFFPSNNPRLPVAETEKNQCATTYPFVDPEFDAKLGSRHHPIQAPVSFSPPPPFSLPAFRSHVHSLAWSQPRVRQEIKTKLDLGREERHDRHHEARAGLAGAAEKRGEEAEASRMDGEARQQGEEEKEEEEEIWSIPRANLVLGAEVLSAVFSVSVARGR